MVRRTLLPIVLGVLTTLALLLSAVPDPHQVLHSALPGAWAETPVDAEAAHPEDAACIHCHEDPHGEQAADTCGTCHTPISWSPSTFDIDRHASTTFALHGRHQETPCAACHVQTRLKGLPTDCAGCHVDRHRGKLGEQCADCHDAKGFTPVADFDHAAKTGFALAGPHGSQACETCHDGQLGRAMRHSPEVTCQTCHAPEHADFEGRACTECHTADHTSFAKADFAHAVTGFALERRHQVQPCHACHPADAAAPMARCQSCHLDPHAGQLGARCDDCHRPDRWRLARFDHDLTAWPLRGRHFTTGCAECHTNQRWIGLTTACWDCHALDAASAPRTVDAHRFGRSDCGDCHSQWSWR